MAASVSVTMTIMPSNFPQSRWFSARSCFTNVLFHQSSRCTTSLNMPNTRLVLSCNPNKKGLQHVLNPISAVSSGLEVSVTDPESLITVKDAKIVVESQDENKIQVRVDLNGEGTQKIFDKVLTNLARSAPPIPGFRREKGGKTTKVPKSFLLQAIGADRVTKFVIQEIVSSTMTDYVNKENLNVKDKKITTSQSPEELKKLFTPGNEFGFNAVMELEKTEAETEAEVPSSSSSENDV